MSSSPATTAKDRLALRFLAEHPVVTTPQLALFLAVSERTARRRLDDLVKQRLAAVSDVYKNQPPAVWITGRGRRAIGSPVGAPRRPLANYRHSIGLTWLWLGARAGRFGDLAEIVSERTMRSADGRVAQSDMPLRPPAGFAAHASGLYEPYGVGLGSQNPAGFGERHHPDLLLQTADGHRIAVELELSVKGRRALQQVMRSYAADNRIDAIFYFVPDERLGARVTAAARAAGIGARLQVHRFGTIDGVRSEREQTADARAAARAGAAARARAGGSTAGHRGRRSRTPARSARAAKGLER